MNMSAFSRTEAQQRADEIRVFQSELDRLERVIRPNLARVPATDLAARGLAITAGEDAARAALPQIRSLIAERTLTRSGGNPRR
jgi:hypothetical protein